MKINVLASLAFLPFTLLATNGSHTLAAPPTLPPTLPPASVPFVGAAFDFRNRPPYRPEIPEPKTILGYEPGDRHTTFRDQERVLLAIADAAKDRVRVVEYGKSVEGRPLRLFLIASPENLAQLDTIRANNRKLADPRSVAAGDADKLTETAPALLWINECIHGDETASFETAMWTLYTLTASEDPAIKAIRQNAVVVLNPVFNPDGHERFVVWYNSIALGSPEGFAYEKSVPWALRGRFNHFRFDMNRDRLAQSQAETQQETAALLSWHPQVYIDQHGQPSVYFFPPNAKATNINVDRDRVTKWTEIFGRANSETFDRYGWNYVVRETYDFFAPIYLDSFATLSGAIGMTYETDGGGNLARRRDDGTISTLRDATAHHFETALTTLQSAATRRAELLRDFVAYRRKAIDDGAHGKFRQVIIPATNDPGRMAELATLLRRVGVEVGETKSPTLRNAVHPYLSADGKTQKVTIPAGSLIVDMTQPQGLVAKAFLEPDAAFEPEFIEAQFARRDRNDAKNDNESREGYDFYDITAWSLPMTFGLSAYWTEDAETIDTLPLEIEGNRVAKLAAERNNRVPEASSVGYVLRPDRDNAFLAALRLLNEGFRVSAVSKSIRIGALEYPPGTFFVRASRNPDNLFERIRALAGELNLTIEAIGGSFPLQGGGLGSDSVFALRRPRIAVAADEGTYQTAFGSVWYFLDKFKIPFTAIKASALPNTDLSRFNVVLLPDGYYGSALGKSGMTKLKEFANSGGALIGFGGGGVWFTEKDADISSSRPVGDGDDDKKDDSKDKKNKKPLELAGSIFRARIDPNHFLGWGYPQGEIAVPLSGSTFLKPSKTGSNVVTFGKAARLSGFVWPNNTEMFLENTAYLIDEPIGNGHAILFLDDPTQRALWPGLYRLVFSGLLFGTSGSPADLR